MAGKLMAVLLALCFVARAETNYVVFVQDDAWAANSAAWSAWVAAEYTGTTNIVQTINWDWYLVKAGKSNRWASTYFAGGAWALSLRKAFDKDQLPSIKGVEVRAVTGPSDISTVAADIGLTYDPQRGGPGE